MSNLKSFSVVYDGEDIANGTIDVRDLAPSLLALADLVDSVAAHGLQDVPRYSLRVKSDFKTGSFEVGLELAHLYQQIVSLFSTQDAQAIASMLQILGISGAFGLFQLVRKSKGRNPTKVTIEHTERVTITFEGEEPDSIPASVFDLFKNFGARKAIERLVEPLNRDGVDTFKFRTNSEDRFVIKKDELPYFKAPSDLEGETVSFAETRLVIVSPSFIPQNKWKFYDGAKNFFASIEDKFFVFEVQRGREAFRKGDMLFVTLKTTQWIEAGRLRVEYAIDKVHSHEPSPRQENLL